MVARLGVFFCLLALFSHSLAAPEPTHVPAQRMTKPPVIDGKFDVEEWKDASYATTFIDPVTSKPANDQTESWFGFDDSAIYFAVKCHDRSPERLAGREIQHGAYFSGEDTVTVRVNTFGTRGWNGRSHFTVNLLNTQSEEIAGGRSNKREWRGEWTSAVQKTADGYIVEMQIPWKILNYPAKEKIAMDLSFERFQAYSNVTSRWPDTGQQDRQELTAVWDQVAPPKQDSRQRMQYMIYTAPEYEHGNLNTRSGLDVRYQLTPTMTALASLNPDFKNIEQQVAGVNFSYTERFFDEQRPFFNEGSGFFNLTGGFGFGKMLYTARRISQFDYGAKTYGQINPKTSIGAFFTEKTGDQTSAVAKISHDFDSKSGVSAYATQMVQGSTRDAAFGFNGYYNRGSFEWDTHVATDKVDDKKPDTAGDVSINYSVPHIFSMLRYEWVSPDFNPGLAYIPWSNRRGFFNYSEVGWDLRTGPLRDFGANIYTSNFETYQSQEQQRGSDIWLGCTFRNDMKLGFNLQGTRYDGQLADIKGAELRINSSNRYKRYGIYTESGTRGGLKSQYTSVEGSYRVFKRADLGFSSAVAINDFDDGGSIKRSIDRLNILTLGYEISDTKSVSGRVVTRDHDVNAYIAYRNGGGKGTETYLILGDPNATKTVARMSVKIVWAF